MWERQHVEIRETCAKSSKLTSMTWQGLRCENENPQKQCDVPEFTRLSLLSQKLLWICGQTATQLSEKYITHDILR